MDSALTTVGLPLALGIIMFGLGLSLTVADFRRVAQHPKVMVIALGCQLILLPLVCFGLVIVFDLPPLLAVGMMLLAASPGGTSANLFSHLFRGDVALNVSLTAVNSVISIVSLPLITNIAIDYFELDDSVGLQFVQGAGGLRDRARARRHRHAGPRQGVLLRGADGPAGADRLGGDPGDPRGRHPGQRGARTSAATSATSGSWPPCSARSAW